MASQPRHDSRSVKASEIAQIAEDNLKISSGAAVADRLALSERSVVTIRLTLDQTGGLILRELGMSAVDASAPSTLCQITPVARQNQG